MPHPHESVNNRYDCLVMGAGPAGSTVATLLAQAGFRTLLAERERMPRFHVGESLMPETYWTLDRLGVLPEMRDSHFVKKYSVQFVTGSGQQSEPFFFSEHDPRDCSQTWQVERADFDHMLFKNAAAKGADCRDQTRVLQVNFDGTRAVGARLQLPGGEVTDVTASVVVDATGQQALISNRLGLQEPLPNLRKAAIWAYFRHAHREAGPHGGATVILHTESKQAWFWYIPLSNDITSVGLVGDNDFLLKGRGTPADAYCDELGHCPALGLKLKQAEMVGEFHVAKEFSYTTREHAGDGWVLVGDAFGFIDPIYSSGVFFALKTGEMAADCIIDGLRRGDTSAAQLGRWSHEFKHGAEWIRKLVEAFYENDFSIGRFMKGHPEYRGNLTDLLIGRVFHDGAGRIFDDLEPALQAAKSATNSAR